MEKVFDDNVLGYSIYEVVTLPTVIFVFFAMLSSYLILRRLFSRPGSKFASNPSIAAHGFVFCVPFIYMSSYGIYSWYFDPSLEAIDHKFGTHPAAQRIVSIMVGTQLYDVPSSILIGGVLASPSFIAHHITVLLLSVFGLHFRFVLYYGVFFMGVIETSTPLLAFVDLFRDFPKFAKAFPTANEIVRVLFAIAFFSVRIFLWIPPSIAFWGDCIEALKGPAEDLHAMPKFIIVFWLLVHAFLTTLQWHWGSIIAKAVYAMIIGDESARANEAKGA